MTILVFKGNLNTHGRWWQTTFSNAFPGRKAFVFDLNFPEVYLFRASGQFFNNTVGSGLLPDRRQAITLMLMVISCVLMRHWVMPTKMSASRGILCGGVINPMYTTSYLLRCNVHIISEELCTRFVSCCVCCGLVPAEFIHASSVSSLPQGEAQNSHILQISQCIRQISHIITLVRHKKALSDTKMHSSTQKFPARHKNARKCPTRASRCFTNNAPSLGHYSLNEPFCYRTVDTFL